MESCGIKECTLPQWDAGAGLCVLHSPKDDKPEFWNVLREREEGRIFKETGLKQVLRPGNEPPVPTAHERDLRERISIRVVGVHFPPGFVPDWLFYYPLDILHCTFAACVSFNGSIIKRTFTVIESTFAGPVDFQQSTIGFAPATIHGCVFQGPLIINSSSMGPLLFRRCSFEDNVRIMKSEIHKDVTFYGCTFNGALSLEDVIPRKGNGQNAIILFEDVRFSNMSFYFSQLDFCHFSACRWKLSGSWLNKRIQGFQYDDPAVQEEQFRQMRRLFSREGNALLANEFALSETETHRLQMKTKARRRRPLEYWTLTVLKYLSFYNVRYLRPLFWLASLVIILPFCHYFGGFAVHTGDTHVRTVHYALPIFGSSSSSQGVSPAQAIGDWLEAVNFTVASMMIRSAPDYSSTSAWSRLARTAGQVGGPALVLLFIFSLRRRFRVPSGFE